MPETPNPSATATDPHPAVAFLTTTCGWAPDVAKASCESLPRACMHCGGALRLVRMRIEAYDDTVPGRVAWVGVSLRCPKLRGFAGWLRRFFWFFIPDGCYTRRDSLSYGMGVLRARGIDAGIRAARGE